MLRLQERWAALNAVVGSSARWQAELKTLAPATLGSMLLASKSKVRRLSYLASQRQQESGALSSLLNMTQREFLSRHPEYKKWTG